MKIGEQLAGIDVHKSMLAVVVGEMIQEGHWQFRRRKFATCASQLKEVEHWLSENQVQEVVMESTAQYWKPVWETLEQYWKPLRQKREGAGWRSGSLHLAQAQSNRGQRGRKRDFPDAERLSEAAGRPRIDSQLCARCCATARDRVSTGTFSASPSATSAAHASGTGTR